jgi:hypothetical protein
MTPVLVFTPYSTVASGEALVSPGGLYQANRHGQDAHAWSLANSGCLRRRLARRRDQG